MSMSMSMSMSDTIGIANNRTAEATQHIMAASSTTRSTNMAGGDVNTNTPGEEGILGAFQ